MRIALATCEELPEPDMDQGILLDCLSRRGAAPEMCVWNDETVEWAEYELCVLRTTWDYHLARDAFLRWLVRVDSVTRVQNPLETVRWNSHKGYLVELAQRGFQVAPTRLVPGGSAARLDDVLRAEGWNDIVVKPAVSASSYETRRFTGADLAVGDQQLTRILERGDALIQQYLPSVHERGERALIFIDGELTHAVRKSPRFHGEEERVEGPVKAEPDEEELARCLMHGAGRGTLYGRVDLARDANGRACLMELELIEPSLFLAQHPEALERFVAAILRRAR